MSHVFISYDHNDIVYLNQILEWFKTNDFNEQDIWYDKNIGSGDNWRDEITTALDEAFLIIVVVSTKSVKSRYCVYEWAYALGQGIPILPLVFDEVSMADVPTPLASKQFTKCIELIPDSLKDHINRLRSVSPQVAVINKIVYNTIYDTHRRFFILGWIGDGFNALDGETHSDIQDYFVREATKARQNLEDLMLDKAAAFNSKQNRLCWNLMDFLKDFSRLNYKYDEYLQERLFPRFDAEWLPAFEYFEGNKWWSKWVRRYFDWELNEHNKQEVLAEMIRAFPDFHVHDVDVLIHNAAADREYKRKQAAQSNTNT